MAPVFFIKKSPRPSDESYDFRDFLEAEAGFGEFAKSPEILSQWCFPHHDKSCLDRVGLL